MRISFLFASTFVWDWWVGICFLMVFLWEFLCCVSRWDLGSCAALAWHFLFRLLRSVTSDSRLPSSLLRTLLTLLDRGINSRLHPATGLNLARVVPKGGAYLAGRKFDEGVSHPLHFPPSLLFNSPEIYPEKIFRGCQVAIAHRICREGFGGVIVRMLVDYQSDSGIPDS